MPMLEEQCSLFPEDLLNEEQATQSAAWALGDCGQHVWWVVYTKARQEKSLARELFVREIPFYLPLVQKAMAYRRQTVFSYSPLFVGYLFLYGSWDQRTRALSTNRISQIWPVNDPQRLVGDLRQIRQLIACKVPLTAESRLMTGNRVRVRHGPLAGLEGTVLVRRGQTRLLVRVDFLQRGASVEVDDFSLEPL